MKRPLNKTEKEMEELGLKRNKKELDMLTKQLEYNLDLLAKQEYSQKLEDKWRPFIRENTQTENDQAINLIKENIANKKSLITIAEDHLKNGVNVKVNQTG